MPILIIINNYLKAQKNLTVTGSKVDIVWSEFKEQERIVFGDIVNGFD